MYLLKTSIKQVNIPVKQGIKYLNILVKTSQVTGNPSSYLKCLRIRTESWSGDYHVSNICDFLHCLLAATSIVH